MAGVVVAGCGWVLLAVDLLVEGGAAAGLLLRLLAVGGLMCSGGIPFVKGTCNGIGSSASAVHRYSRDGRLLSRRASTLRIARTVDCSLACTMNPW
eukprot:6049962-Amphidinium_carterae.2